MRRFNRTISDHIIIPFLACEPDCVRLRASTRTTQDLTLPSLSSHADVLGGGGEGHPERRGELAEIALPTGELPDDRAARGMGQGMENPVEPGRTI
jgi:hypothetical protein